MCSVTYLKALYTGLYQQTKEQGVERRTQRMDRPKPTPLAGSAQNIARQEIKLKNSVHAVTGRGTENQRQRHKFEVGDFTGRRE